uniref:Uncharacterized protein n=1 Tax=uncultured Armatimonadetes bacterium TaxID=157466 RepID=A0A6J4IZ71_9BACT|nr:hypothetical protein AVDCRST_MAG63-2604 [uncultured Armatimonadetes bacterium]
MSASTSANSDPAEESFRRMIRSLDCPFCGLGYTDHAVDWGWAWSEGRADALREQGRDERDGPFKLKCELCGKRAWLNYFAKTVTSAESDSA